MHIRNDYCLVNEKIYNIAGANSENLENGKIFGGLAYNPSDLM
jgi:hypothetical protein